tara:strand:- start:63 stop:527 length:465 start_codon:yes stop_codon:yes gene_type:complete
MSMVIAGFTLSMFFLLTPSLFINHTHKLKITAIIAAVFGILGSLAMIGVGFTPADIFFPPHVLFAHWLFRFFFVTSFFITLCIYQSPDFKNKYAIGYLIFSLVIFFYIIFNEFGPKPHENQWSLYMQVVSQKAILLCFFAAILIQTKGINKIIK